MTAKRQQHMAALAIVGAAAGITLVVTTGAPPQVGMTLCFLSVVALAMRFVRKWTIDASAERQRLRFATAELDEARQQNQVAAALTLAERERVRARGAAVERHAVEAIGAERARADQAEINAAQRAVRAEAQAEERIQAEVTRLNEQAENGRLELMMEQYFAGARDAESGQLDVILAMLAAQDGNVIRLDDHRTSPSSPTGTGAH